MRLHRFRAMARSLVKLSRTQALFLGHAPMDRFPSPDPQSGAAALALLAFAHWSSVVSRACALESIVWRRAGAHVPITWRPLGRRSLSRYTAAFFFGCRLRHVSKG